MNTATIIILAITIIICITMHYRITEKYLQHFKVHLIIFTASIGCLIAFAINVERINERNERNLNHLFNIKYNSVKDVNKYFNILDRTIIEYNNNKYENYKNNKVK